MPNFASPAARLTARERFIRTVAGLTVDRPPVWLMRQAGRYMADYRAVRSKHTFLEMVHTPELAAEVTLQPVRQLGVDAAILFSDILTIPEAMGMQVAFPEGGPQLSPVVQTAADVARLAPVEAVERLRYVADAVRLVRQQLGQDHALIGFSGAPFTLACYMVEGKGTKSYDGIKALMYTHPKIFAALLDKLADWVIAYLQMQFDAGADVVQLFDSWAGELRAEDYRDHVLPSTTRIAQALRAKGIPLMLFARNPGHLLDLTLSVPVRVLGLDQRCDLGLAAHKAKALGIAVQGNLDPIELFAPHDVIARRVREMASAVDGCPWIANLGHGIVPATPMAGVQAFVAAVQALAREAP